MVEVHGQRSPIGKPVDVMSSMNPKWRSNGVVEFRTLFPHHINIESTGLIMKSTESPRMILRKTTDGEDQSIILKIPLAMKTIDLPMIKIFPFLGRAGPFHHVF
jgi:hypothetical protein